MSAPLPTHLGAFPDLNVHNKRAEYFWAKQKRGRWEGGGAKTL